MSFAILSDDRPRSRMLSLLLILVLAALLLTPFLFSGTRSVDTAARIAIFIVLAASYDLLLGYTGIVSFAHTMFFGIGAYGVAIASREMGAGWDAILLGGGTGIALAVVVAFAVGLLSLRVRAIFFAMMTLAVASAFAILASQLFTLTGGEDGITYGVPRSLTPAFRLFDERVFGVRIDGRILSYYLVVVCALILFLLMLRIVNSPFGRVLQAIRENDFRAEAIGFPVVIHRTVATCVSAAFAAAAGVLMAIWLRYTGPDTTLSFTIMMDILLMVVIGGMGTLYGSVLGATLFILAQTHLRTLMGVAADAVSGVPVLPALLHPDRWLLWLGVLFVLSVYFFPSGIVGRLRRSSV